jgi:hypothetical protein
MRGKETGKKAFMTHTNRNKGSRRGWKRHFLNWI